MKVSKPALAIPEDIKVKAVSDEGDHYFISPRARLEYLPGGIYRITLNSTENVLLFKQACDDEVENHSYGVEEYFPMEEYHEHLGRGHASLQNFLSSESLYKENKWDYRYSMFLYGEPGTGKSRYIMNVVERLIHDLDAITIRVESASDLFSLFYRGAGELDRLFKERFIIIWIEEVSEILRSGSNSSNSLLHLLDAFALRHRVLIFMTTNYPKSIPSNIVDRPSRINQVLKIDSSGYSDDFPKAWHEHVIGKKMSPHDLQSSWFKEAKSFLSADYWKELFAIGQKLGSLEEAWIQIKRRKTEIKDDFGHEVLAPTNPLPVGFSFPTHEGAPTHPH